jgi:hypothetical protein
VGDVGKLLDVVQRISPGLVDQILVLIGFKFQKTNEPKFEDAPDNLYEPIPAHDKVEGDFGNLTIPAFTDWLDKNPPVKWGAAAAAALGVAAAFKGFFPGNDI